MLKAAAEDSITVQDRLLNAAEQVVARDGVGNFTLDAVAREAGVSKGGLLYHFPSKSALITQVVERMAASCEERQAASIQGQPHTPGAFTRAYLDARVEGPEPQRVPIHSALLAAAGTDRQYLDPFRRRFKKWQENLESDDIDPAVATIARLAIDAICLWTVLGVTVPQGELRRKVMETLMAMTRVPGTNKGKDESP